MTKLFFVGTHGLLIVPNPGRSWTATICGPAATAELIAMNLSSGYDELTLQNHKRGISACGSNTGRSGTEALVAGKGH